MRWLTKSYVVRSRNNSPKCNILLSTTPSDQMSMAWENGRPKNISGALNVEDKHWLECDHWHRSATQLKPLIVKVNNTEAVVLKGSTLLKQCSKSRIVLFLDTLTNLPPPSLKTFIQFFSHFFFLKMKIRTGEWKPHCIQCHSLLCLYFYQCS